MWSISEEDYNILNNIPQKQWSRKMGWWIFTDFPGEKNSPVKEININGNSVKVYIDVNDILNYCDDKRIQKILWLEEGQDYWPVLSIEELSSSELNQYWESHMVYDNFIEFSKDVWQYSNLQNVGRFLIINAILNKTTVSKFAELVMV